MEFITLLFKSIFYGNNPLIGQILPELFSHIIQHIDDDYEATDVTESYFEDDEFVIAIAVFNMMKSKDWNNDHSQWADFRYDFITKKETISDVQL